MDCGKSYPLGEYIDEIDQETWLKISLRNCDRA